MGALLLLRYVFIFVSLSYSWQLCRHNVEIGFGGAAWVRIFSVRAARSANSIQRCLFRRRQRSSDIVSVGASASAFPRLRPLGEIKLQLGVEMAMDPVAARSPRRRCLEVIQAVD